MTGDLISNSGRVLASEAVRKAELCFVSSGTTIRWPPMCQAVRATDLIGTMIRLDMDTMLTEHNLAIESREQSGPLK